MSKAGQISTIIDDKLREDFDVAVARRRMKMKDALAEAIQLWLEAAVPTEASVPFMPRNRDVHEDTHVGTVDTRLGVLLGEILDVSRETLRTVKAQGAPRGKAQTRQTAEKQAAAALRKERKLLGKPTRRTRGSNQSGEKGVA